jgi:hypothetical protein
MNTVANVVDWLWIISICGGILWSGVAGVMELHREKQLKEYFIDTFRTFFVDLFNTIMAFSFLLIGVTIETVSLIYLPEFVRKLSTLGNQWGYTIIVIVYMAGGLTFCIVYFLKSLALIWEEALPSEHPRDNADNHGEKAPDNTQAQGKEQKPL